LVEVDDAVLVEVEVSEGSESVEVIDSSEEVGSQRERAVHEKSCHEGTCSVGVRKRCAVSSGHHRAMRLIVHSTIHLLKFSHIKNKRGRTGEGLATRDNELTVAR